MNARNALKDLSLKRFSVVLLVAGAWIMAGCDNVVAPTPTPSPTATPEPSLPSVVA